MTLDPRPSDAELLARLEAQARVIAPRIAADADLAYGNPSISPTDFKRANVLEKQEQHAIASMARAIGMTVRSTSQARASKIAPGIPDLILARKARHFFGFWETKRQVGGKLSTSQQEFADDCDAAGVPWGHGDRYAFAQFLTDNGFVPPPIPE